LRAEGYALRRDLEDALKEFQAALQLRPKEAELHERAGELYVDNHKDDDAQGELAESNWSWILTYHAPLLLGLLYCAKTDNERLCHICSALCGCNRIWLKPALVGTRTCVWDIANAIPKLEKAAPLDHYGNVHNSCL